MLALLCYGNIFLDPVIGDPESVLDPALSIFVEFLNGWSIVLNAKKDPIVGYEVLPKIDEVSKFVTLEYPAEGGHCGFPRKPNEGSLGFLPTRTFDFCFRGR